MSSPSTKKVKKQKSIKYYLGLDLSLTSTGFVLADKKCNHILNATITSRPKDPIEVRLYRICQDIIVLIKAHVGPHHKIKLAAIEGLSVRGAGQRTLQLAGLHYYVRAELAVNFPTMKIAIVPPKTLKKFIANDGNSQKDKMMLCAYKRWKFDANNSDECDAFCLTRFLTENKKNIKKDWWI
jgi:Holliday junction resolvasome RuvABC endonuclease subunit